MAKEDRGFASMDRGRQREIAQKGGKAAHVKGTAHEWSREEARIAGRKGGLASHSLKTEDEAIVPEGVDEMKNKREEEGPVFRPAGDLPTHDGVL